MAEDKKLQYLFSAALKKLEFFQTRATVALISTCAFSRGPSEKHHPCDLGVSDGAPAVEKTLREQEKQQTRTQFSLFSAPPIPTAIHHMRFCHEVTVQLEQALTINSECPGGMSLAKTQMFGKHIHSSSESWERNTLYSSRVPKQSADTVCKQKPKVSLLSGFPHKRGGENQFSLILSNSGAL